MRLFNAAQKEVNRGCIAEAAQFVRQVLDIDPRNALALNGLAEIAFRLGRLDEAIQFARRASEEDDSYIFTLALIYKYKRNYPAARDCYVRRLKNSPSDVRALFELADLYERSGYRQVAIKYFEQLLSQAYDTTHYQQYGKLLPFSETPRKFAMLQQAPLPAAMPDEEQLKRQMEYTSVKNAIERVALGLPHMARSLEELFFPHASRELEVFERDVDEVLRHSPTILFAHHAKAMCLVARQKHQESEPFFRHLAKAEPSNIYVNITFEQKFYADLSVQNDADIFNVLPTITDIVTAKFGDGPIIFLSCDYTFFMNYGRPMLSSIHAVSPGSQVHVHIMNAPDNFQTQTSPLIAALPRIKIAFSVEKTAVATREYYHAVRFVRLYQFLQRYRQPLWLLDVDALLNNDINPTFAAMGDSEVGLVAHTGIWSPWNQFRAGIVGIHPTTRGLTYAKLIAGYIAAFYKQNLLRWGIDQAALYGVYFYLTGESRAPVIKLYDDLLIDSDCVENGVIWCNSGVNKFEQLVVLDDNLPFDSPRVKYMDALRKLGYVAKFNEQN